MQMLLSDWKFSVRRLARTPGFALTAVLMLAFGIGATTAIFSVVDGILLRPLAFPDPGRLVTIGDTIGGTGWGSGGQGPVSATEAVIYARDTHSFSSLGSYRLEFLELAGSGEPAQVTAARMSPGLFTALGVQPRMGRLFTRQEDTQGAKVALLSYATWKSRFGGDPGIVGRRILLNREPYVVIGVMPKSFDYPMEGGSLNRCELWVPMSYTAEELSPDDGADWAWGMAGRLKPGVTLAQAQDDAEHAAQEIMRGLPPALSSFHISAHVMPLAQATLERARPLLRLLFLAVAVVLLIACANFAGLLLVRSIYRQRETAVRVALGAQPAVLLRQALLESLTLSLAGGLLGIALAAIAVSAGGKLLPASLPRLDNIGLNGTVVMFALVLALLTGLICGLAPAFASLRTNVNASLKEGGRSGPAGGRHARLRSALVIAEVAIAIMLLSASGLLLRSFRKMSSVSLGFYPEGVATASYSLPKQDYGTQARIDAFNRTLLQKLEQLPGAESAGLSSILPGASWYPMETVVVEGFSADHGSSAAANFAVVGDFFQAAGIDLLRGRLLSPSDTANSPLVVVVNRSFAHYYWPGENPLGRRVRLGTPQMQTPWMTVVGEVADAKLGSPDEPAGRQFYQPVSQMPRDVGSYLDPGDVFGNQEYIVLRAALPAAAMEGELRRVVRSIDPQLPLTHVETMEQVLSHSEAPRRFNTVLVSCFALAALLLAVLGIYSVIAFSTAARVQEMAIRMALGAQRGGIMKLVLRSGLLLAGIGCVIGLAGAAAASSLLRSFLFDVSPWDPLTMAGAAAVVLVLALAASAIPARRAASVDPMKALRGE